MGSERKIVVPEGMLNAAESAEFQLMRGYRENLRSALGAALQHHAENPPVPTEEQLEHLRRYAGNHGSVVSTRGAATVIAEWLRMAYAAPEPPSEIADLLWELPDQQFRLRGRTWDQVVEEAFRRGEIAGAQKAGSNE